MKFALIASSIALCTFVSCGQGDDDVSTSAQAPAPATTDAPAPAASSAPGMSAPVKIPLNLRGLTAVGQAGGAGLNPEHGKPGHRCDIAVGAPLNSAPASNTAQPVAVPTQASTPVVLPSNSTSTISASSGLNPEHGKPGHRCDIAVGAPLNSKPAPSGPITPIKPAVTTVAPGMNPQHGQPGHRCDIAVGAPLNSKPVPATTTTPAPTPSETETKKDSTGGL